MSSLLVKLRNSKWSCEKDPCDDERQGDGRTMDGRNDSCPPFHRPPFHCPSFRSPLFRKSSVDFGGRASPRVCAPRTHSSREKNRSLTFDGSRPGSFGQRVTLFFHSSLYFLPPSPRARTRLHLTRRNRAKNKDINADGCARAPATLVAGARVLHCLSAPVLFDRLPRSKSFSRARDGSRGGCSFLFRRTELAPKVREMSGY